MNKFQLFLFLVCTQIAFGQGSIEDYPTRQIEKKAKKSTKIYLDSLVRVLDLDRRLLRVKHFELFFCKGQSNDTLSTATLTPVGEFPSINGCPGFYTYTQSRDIDNSRYAIRLFYNRKGEIVEKEISYIVVTH